MINQNRARFITFNILQPLIYLVRQRLHFNNAISYYMELKNKITIAMYNLKPFLTEALGVKVHQLKLKIKDQLIIKSKVLSKNR